MAKQANIKLSVRVIAPSKRSKRYCWTVTCPRTGCEETGATREEALQKIEIAYRDMVLDPETVQGSVTKRWYMLHCIGFQFWRISILGSGSTLFSAPNFGEARKLLAEYVDGCEDAQCVIPMRVTVEASPETVEIDHCSICGEPAHASETDDLDRHPHCVVVQGQLGR